MKAIRKSDGKIIEVEAIVYNRKNGVRYSPSELDFNVDADETVISGWVARNNDNSLYLYLFKAEPWYNSPRGYWDEPIFSIGCFSMPSELFPQITFDNSPMEVEITIKPKKR